MYILLIIFVFAGGQTTAKTVLTTKQACVATKAVGERSSFLDFEASKTKRMVHKQFHCIPIGEPKAMQISP